MSKYQPPYGSTDPNAGWVDGNPSSGVEGSIPSAKSFEQPQRELANAVAGTGQTGSDADLTQILQAISTGIYVGTFTGTANALTATLPGSVTIPALREGLVIIGYVGASPNTGAAALTLSGFTAAPGSKAIRRKDGTSALASGDLISGALVSFRYDGTAFRHIGVTPSDIAAVLAGGNYGYAVDASGVANAIVVTLTGFPGAYADGQLIRVKIANGNTGATTVKVNALAAVPTIRNEDSSPLQQGDVSAGMDALLQYDSTTSSFRLLNPPQSKSGQFRTIQTLTLTSDVASVTMALPSAFAKFRMTTFMKGLADATGLQISTDGGATYLSTGTSYSRNFWSNVTASSTSNDSKLALVNNWQADAAGYSTGIATISAGSASERFQIASQTFGKDPTSGFVDSFHVGTTAATGRATNIKLIPFNDTGNYTSSGVLRAGSVIVLEGLVP